MSSRYGGGHLHQRDARSQLFDNNNNNSGSGYGYGYGYGYPGGSSSSDGRSPRVASAYRPATPNARGQYSASVLEELESQNDAQVEGLSAKVKMLKDITEAIGEEVRSSSTLVASMNDSFDSTRAKLQGTMSNMMRMARRTGVGWKAWLLFICAVVFMFWYVWLF